MRSGSRARAGLCGRRGFTYLGLLVLMALQGAALAALGRHMATAVHRDREAELLFRGEQIRQAIASYHAAQTPANLPAELDDLLADRRGDRTRHHLRQRYADPFTGRADWELIRARQPDGTPGPVIGVMSRSTAARMRQDGPLVDTAGPPRVRDWQFRHDAIAPAAASAASAASAP